MNPKHVEGCLDPITEDRPGEAATLQRLLEREDTEHVLLVLRTPKIEF